MGIYTKVVSVLRPIEKINVLVEGSIKNVKSAHIFVEGQIRKVFPITETYTLIKEIPAGEYSETLPWGKYKILISGGGGSGGVGAATHDDWRNWFNAGSAGEEIEMIIKVKRNQTKIISGIVGTGGKECFASVAPDWISGDAGVGYENGQKGLGYTYWGGDRSAAVGGSGGGSSSLLLDGELTIAKGGNGGDANADEIGPISYGGNGGSGGVDNGTGASGGAGGFGYKGASWGKAGSDGYVKIYQSDVYPMY